MVMKRLNALPGTSTEATQAEKKKMENRIEGIAEIDGKKEGWMVEAYPS
jgi:hypothetical protein